eukprot:TRINITY_DN30856_c0_g1_i2.p1 TRINITY_DN30856_c0_g1~~TRINITY_DN30856_c0_g1_i2.p1  ORF type:complete len:319 (-),score=31.25 TRINITY_DN30856_c0_g1_i2:186-1118(-)
MAAVGTESVLPSSPVSTAESGATSSAFWAEFQRRRREDRQQRQQPSRISEVQQILIDVRKERAADGCSTMNSPELEASRTLGSASPFHCNVGGDASSPQIRRTLSFSPSPRKPSEIQKILAEVQQERLAATGAPTSGARGKAAVCRQALFGSKTGSCQQQPVQSRQSSVSRKRHSSLGMTVSAKCQPNSVTGSRKPTSSRRRSTSTTPKRRHQIGSVSGSLTSGSFETSQSRDWGAGLRRNASLGSLRTKACGATENHDQAGDDAGGKPVAYPAGGCPKMVGMIGLRAREVSICFLVVQSRKDPRHGWML